MNEHLKAIQATKKLKHALSICSCPYLFQPIHCSYSQQHRYYHDSKQKKKDKIKKYHKIIQGLETIADIQLQLQNIVKLADIKTTLLQASKNYKIDRDIYSISEEL